MTTKNIALILILYVLFMIGLLLSMGELTEAPSSKKQVFKQRYAFFTALLAFIGLGTFFCYVIIGILLALLLISAANVLPRWLAFTFAILTPLIAGLTDVYFKNTLFYLEVKMLFILFNCLILLYSYKMIAERQQKSRYQHLLQELQATQALLSITAKRDERLRISRDLHDSLGHKLTALRLQLELASHVSKEKVSKKIFIAKKISDALLFDLRNTVSDFRENDYINLAEAIDTLCQEIPRLQVNHNVDLANTMLSIRQADVLYRCVQESLTNIIKHANATHCDIHLYIDEGDIKGVIQDNGQQCQDFQAGNGLLGMQERLKILDGQLHYAFNQQGFYVHFSLPFATQQTQQFP
jgi:signal transduction histidine kinase